MRLVGGYYHHHYPRAQRQPRARVRPVWIWALCALTRHRIGQTWVDYTEQGIGQFHLSAFHCQCGAVHVNRVRGGGSHNGT